MKSRRSVQVVGHVVFTGPRQLDGHADLFRDRCRLDDIVVAEAATKTTANAREVKFDVSGSNAQRSRHKIEPAGWSLRRCPDFQLPVFEVGRAVLWLHRRVRDEW